ncbi:chorismate mutase [Klebsormidium nitens]|uniref:chorismate mutase n=1 Tax=Klebsormidium nitens TaxID=105231 RepID=A0A1Y1HWC4_KLENI|nr:chorismate mutase [Klebsormidium nitens]|eukprot:GAQ82935.1 chorismate mutase [Klebsormidium nitens]
MASVCHHIPLSLFSGHIAGLESSRFTYPNPTAPIVLRTPFYPTGAPFCRRGTARYHRKSLKVCAAAVVNRVAHGGAAEPVMKTVILGTVDESENLTLDKIRDNLIRQEDTIIFSLIERAQFRQNSAAYDAKSNSVPGFDGSLLDYLLKETEHLHAKVRRYTSPVEHPFFPDDLPEPVLPPLAYPQVLAPAAKDININPRIRAMYFEDLLPKIASAGDDGNYGSTACSDVLCLQALSARIHYGKFVAEAKFRQQPDLYIPLIEAQDKQGLVDLLTFPAQEQKVLDRVELKAATYGQDVTQAAPLEHRTYKIEPKEIARLYGEWIIPLNKDVQIQYLLRRLDER